VTPAAVAIPERALSATFTVTAARLTSPADVGIIATYAGATRAARLTVRPADTVAVGRADDTASKRSCRSRRSTTDSTGTSALSVYTTDSNQLIGTLTGDGTGRDQGQPTWLSSPRSVTVRSGGGGFAARGDPQVRHPAEAGLPT